MHKSRVELGVLQVVKRRVYQVLLHNDRFQTTHWWVNRYVIRFFYLFYKDVITQVLSVFSICKEIFIHALHRPNTYYN